MSRTIGVLQVHSCPTAVTTRLEWSLSSLVGVTLRCKWQEQPFEPGQMRTSIEWVADAGTVTKIASTLRGFEDCRFEVWQAGEKGKDSIRYLHTPSLGLFYTLTDAAGNSMVGEDRIRYALGVADGDVRLLEAEIDKALGLQWEKELEPYRECRVREQLPAQNLVSGG